MVRGSCAPRRRGDQRVLLGLFALTAVAVASGSLAQTVPAAAPIAAAPAVAFAIKGFKVGGVNPMGEAETASVLAPYIRSDAKIETLQEATAALEKALRDRGYGLHRVSLPPQEVGDTVKLNIVKFNMGKISIEGRSIYDVENIRRTLPELQEGGTPNFKTLAIQTAIANENPNKQIQVGLRESEQPDKIDATVTVKEQRPWNIGFGVSNGGSPNSGQDRLTVTASHTNLFNLDHQFAAAYTTSVERGDDVRQFGLSYRVPLYSLGGVVGATYTRSDVVGDFGTFSSTGAGHTFGVNYTHYLAPQGGRRSYVTVLLDDKVFNATEISGVIVGMDRRSRPVTVGYTARVESDTVTWGYSADLAMNTGTGEHNDLVSYQNEDPRVQTVHWKALRGGANYSAAFGANWIWAARANVQYSPDVLISGEQFGLGGLGSVRGTEIDRPVTGDSGITGTLELTTPELTGGLRAAAFVDGGWLSNNDANGTNKPSNDRVASAGVGLRYAREQFGFSLDYGRIVTGSRVPLSFNSAAPQRGDERLYVNLLARF
jgi:hemolysin activation/secretion protein